MTVERTLRLIAGSFILLSLALGHYVSPYWYLHGFCRPESVSIRINELVPYDDLPTETGSRQVGESEHA